MDLTILRTLILVCAILCIGFGFLSLISPDSAHRLSQAVDRTILMLDTAFGKKPRMSGAVLLLVGILFLFFMY